MRLDAPNFVGHAAPLEERATVLREDFIVMTLACDLEQQKVHDVVLCRHISLIAFRKKDWKR